MKKISPLEIVKRTPSSNCRECGYPTCLAFGAAVVATGINLTTCPHINLQGLQFSDAPPPVDQKEKDLQFISHLKEKIDGYDFSGTAKGLGAVYKAGDCPKLFFSYLGQEVSLSKDDILINNQPPKDHRDQILLYNYVFFKGGKGLAAEWLGMESLPNSISKIKTLATYCEDRLAVCFSGLNEEKIRDIFSLLSAVTIEDSTADIAYTIPVLPMLPMFVLFWAAEPEDNFPAKVKVLFDRDVLSVLDLESMVFCAERLADIIIGSSF